MQTAENKDFNEVQEIQKCILAAYEQDFSKHAPYEIVPKIPMIWNSIPSQLGKKNKKFIYGLIREGSRAKEYEPAMMWLADCGLVHKVSRVNVAGIPLKAYEDLRAFKLFLVDVGLLGCMTGLRQRILLDGNDRGSCEVDFVIDTGERVVPVEVKTEVNLKAKSLGVYKDKFDSKISVRTSTADYKKEDWLVNLPLYAVEEIIKMG